MWWLPTGLPISVFTPTLFMNAFLAFSYAPMTTIDEICHQDSSRVGTIISKGLPPLDKMPGPLDAQLTVF
jgi:hypothetical protein